MKILILFMHSLCAMSLSPDFIHHEFYKINVIGKKVAAYRQLMSKLQRSYDDKNYSINVLKANIAVQSCLLIDSNGKIYPEVRLYMSKGRTYRGSHELD